MAEESELEFVEACAARVLAGETLDEDTLYRLAEINSDEAIALI